MKVKVLSAKAAPSFLGRIIGQVFKRPAPPLAIKRNQIPYWQERGWRQEGKTYLGTYKTAFGSFIGRIEQVRPGNFRLYTGAARPQPLELLSASRGWEFSHSLVADAQGCEFSHPGH